MKARIGETDRSAVDGEIFWRNENHTATDDEKRLLYIYTNEEHTKVKEILNMTSPNFHSVKFEGK